MDREEQYIPDDPGALGETHLLHQRDFASFLLQPVQDTNDKPFSWTTRTEKISLFCLHGEKSPNITCYYFEAT